MLSGFKLFGILILVGCIACTAVFFTPDHNGEIPLNSDVSTRFSFMSSDTSRPPPLSLQQYAPNNIVFLLDISNSMSKDNKMDLLQKSMSVLLERLRPIDRVALITFGNFPDLLYSTTSFSDPDSLKKILKKVRSTASATNVNGGVEEAYERARSVFIKQANNEVLLITDGEFILNKHTTELVRNTKEINMTCVIIGTDAGAIKAAEYVKSALQLNLVTLINEATDLNVLLENVKSRSANSSDKTQ